MGLYFFIESVVVRVFLFLLEYGYLLVFMMEEWEDGCEMKIIKLLLSIIL